MGAIAGLYHFKGRPIAVESIKILSDAVKEIGNDGHQKWHNNNISLFKSYMDIAPEASPSYHSILFDEYVVVADVRIDNRLELIRSLMIPFALQASIQDEELLYKAYLKWDVFCLNYLLGRFAFGIWDPKKKRLFCARDPIGEAPFYFYKGNDYYAFATVARHLLRLPWVSKKLDEQSIADFLVMLPENIHGSYYRDIQKLPPGHLAIINEQGSNILKYWSAENISRINFNSEREYIQAFLEILFDAVYCRIKTDHPVGAYLSGGLDSSTVAVTAADQLDRKHRVLETYTSVADSVIPQKKRIKKFGNEGPLVKEISSQIPNIKTNFISIQYQSPLEQLIPAFEIAGPPRNAFNYIWHRLIAEKAKQDGVRVLLNGNAGNYAMSRTGYNYLSELAHQGYWIRLFHELKDLNKVSGRSIWYYLGSKVLKPFFLTYQRHFPIDRSRWLRNSAIHPVFAKENDILERIACYIKRNRQAMGFDSQFIRHQDALRDISNSNRDVTSLWAYNYQISLRDPTNDKRLVAFALGIPDKLYLSHGRDRYLLREAMKMKLPKSVRMNTKTGYQGADWMHCFESAKSHFNEELELLRTSPMASRVLDLGRMTKLLSCWSSVAPHSSQAIRDYRHLFARGLILGKFLKWHENEYDTKTLLPSK